MTFALGDRVVSIGQHRIFSPARRESYPTSLLFPENSQFIDENLPVPNRVSGIHVLACDDCETTRVRPSRFHVLQNFTSLRALTRNITHCSHRVLDSQTSLAHGERQRVCATPGESPGNQIMLLNSVLAEPAAQGSMRVSARIRSRALPRGRNTVGWFMPTLSDNSGGLAPVGAPSGLRLRGKEP
jgi:hypothetical protein